MTSSLDTNIEYNSVNWTPLKQPDNFRIVHLSAGKGDEPLSCVLKEFPIDDLQGSYIAISYTWRTAKLTRTIACNGYKIRITRNLHSALRRIRLPTQYLRIWCDALCIRQGSDEESLAERAQQIPLMGRIFASAARVVVDLGDDDGTLSHALEGINAILATPRDLRLRCHLESNPLEFLKLPEFTHPMWSALRVFLSRPWFQRLWTVQEVTLARDIRVVFGPYAMTFEQLVSVASVHNLIIMAAGRTYQTMTWNVSEWSTPRLATTCLVSTFRRRNARIAAGDTYAEGLCDLIMSTLSQLSTDPRDRVYALYGMVGPQLAKELPVSYSENVAQLSQRLSEYFLRTGNGAWMLAHSGGISPDRPSWCINLDGQMRKERFDPLAGMTQPAGDNTLYAAGGTPVAELRAEANNGRVTVRGVVADEIKSMSPPCPLEGELVAGVDADLMFTPFSAISYGLWIYFIVEWARPLSCSNPDALWRTLIANFNPHSDDLSPFQRLSATRLQNIFRQPFHVDGKYDPGEPSSRSRGSDRDRPIECRQVLDCFDRTPLGPPSCAHTRRRSCSRT